MMTVHVLHAGDGYTYLTRQVASGDYPRARGESLADYYTAHGNPPGVWAGSGIARLDVEGTVSEAQMRALFGHGLHPDAERQLPERIALYVAAGASPARAAAAAERDVRLGRRFPTFTPRVEGWSARLTPRYATEADRLGLTSAKDLTADDRDRVRRALGTATYRELHGRDPATEAELRAWVARQATPARQPVAGYDLVFTPVKSVSVLWALAAPDVAGAVEDAHHAAVAQALAFVESHAALTRTGAGGLAQVDTHGLVVAMFDHRDSRTGDPNLHTHAAVSTKVQGRDGRWRSLDGRALFALAVAASETYNTAVEDELRSRLGVTFTQRTRGQDVSVQGRTPVRVGNADLRAVRDIDGIDPRLLARFASRRAAVEADYQDRLAGYRHRWGHEPSRAVAMKLAQEATLATRGAKDTPRSLQELRAGWVAQARDVLGVTSDQEVRDAVHRAVRTRLTAQSAVEVEAVAEQVLGTVADHRATWRVWHLRAEAERRLRATPVASPQDRDSLVTRVTAAARAGSVLLTVPPAETISPPTLTRADGESVFTVHGAALYTSTAVLDAETRLVAAARHDTGRPPVPGPVLTAALDRSAGSGAVLDSGQRELARVFATSPRLLVAGIGPAGTGKTTAMRVLVAAAAAAGTRVIGLAPSARAAQVLTDELGVRADTLHKFLHHPSDPAEIDVRAGDVLLVDEAGMAGTLRLARLVDLATARGAVVRLLGDPRQLAAVESGGALRLIEAEVGAVHLEIVHRFADPAEAAATLRLRDGDPAALDFYETHDRVRDGGADEVTDAAYAAWHADDAAGRSAVLLAATGEQVRDLCARARLDRIAEGRVDPTHEVGLHDGTHAGAGDIVVTRRNDRRLVTSRGRDWVTNGDLWRVAGVGEDGSLDVTHLRRRGRTRLPAAYVAAEVELGYAATVHRAQGITVDAAHVLVDETTTRQALYTALTRGRAANHLYVATSGTLAVDADRPPAPERAAREVLLAALARDGAERPATHVRRDERAAAGSLARLVPEYLHAYGIYAEQAYGLRQVVLEVLGPDLGRQAVEDGAWPRLAAALAVVGSAGGDVRAALARAAAQRELTTSDSIAEVLAWRLEPAPCVVAGLATATGLPFGMPPPPHPSSPQRAVVDPALPAWLEQRAERIRGRLDALAVSARTRHPAWLERLGPRPDEPSVARRWDAALHAVLAYRDEHQVDDAHSPLGPRPEAGGGQQRVWDAAYAEVARAPRTTVVRRRQQAAAAGDDISTALRGGPFLH